MHRGRQAAAAGRVARGLAMVVLGVLPAVAVDLEAQTYPSRSVRVVAPYGAGSASDTLARLLNEHLGHALGAPFVLENKPGATGTLAASEVARAAPDGYTLLLALSGTHSINPVLYRKLPYDPVRDFTPIARLTLGQSVFAVPASLPVNSLQELVAYGKANPGRIAFAAHNAFATFGLERFRMLTGIDMVRVPYKTYSDAVSDLVAGRIQLGIMDILNTTPLIREGKLKGLALTGAQRSALNPGIPPARDAGIPEFTAYSWIGMVGPAGLPGPIVQRLHAAIDAAMTSPRIVEQLKRIEYYYVPQKPEEFAKFITDQLALYSAIARQAGIEPQ